MKKKAQGLSLNTIIIAAIVLIVLIVLWAIFTGKMGGFTQGLKGTAEGDAACNDVCVATGIYTGGKHNPNSDSECTGLGSGYDDFISTVQVDQASKACCCKK